MDKYYQVICQGEEKSFIEGTTFKEIADYYKKYYDKDIIGVKVNEDFDDLGSSLRKDSVIDFFTVGDEYGYKVYSRSARFILLLAVKKKSSNTPTIFDIYVHEHNNEFKIMSAHQPEYSSIDLSDRDKKKIKRKCMIKQICLNI